LLRGLGSKIAFEREEVTETPGRKQIDNFGRIVKSEGRAKVNGDL
jgi:hypothetical protein